MRALQRLARADAALREQDRPPRRRAERVLGEIAQRLTPAVARVDSAESVAAALAEHDDALLAANADGDGLAPERLRQELAAQTAAGLVYPVFFGSARTGAGVDALSSGIVDLLPAREGDADGPLSGTVFKIERGRSGEKIAYARLFSGTVCARDRLGEDEKVTALSVFEDGGAPPAQAAAAGQIAQSRPRRRPDRRRHRRARRRRSAQLRPADAGVGRCPGPPRGEGRARRRSRSARGAGPADQPAPGRRPPGALRLALRRGAERGDPGDARARLRRRGRVQRDDDHLRRATARQRRGARGAEHGVESVPGDDRAAGSTRRRPARASSSGRRSTRARSRSTCSRRSAASPSTWTPTSATRCARVCPAGR